MINQGTGQTNAQEPNRDAGLYPGCDTLGR